MEYTEDDSFQNKNKLKIEFSLQKGSYATMLLCEIIKFGSSFGVSIPKKLVKELNFKKDESLQVDFRKPV